jgi:ATP-dependent RNA helicase RhlE
MSLDEETLPMSFTSFSLQPGLLRAVDELSFGAPTAIQADAIPPALTGRDVLACAVTGSGKTAAFLLPILHRLTGSRRGVTRALVLAPTRELAAQIDEHRRQLARHVGVAGAAVFGGVGMEPQEQAFRRGADVLVATPGRLLDHFRFSYARLQGLEVLVLDEADRMLDMGFLPDIRRILQHLPARRQTLLFSATMPPPIVALAREMLRNPVTINIERPSAPAAGITHAAYPVAPELKSRLLLELLRGPDVRNALAFTRTKHRANRLAEFLVRHQVSADRIHGNRSQSQRTQALAGFKAGRVRVLVATDIAARGIDISELSHVVNFDVPGLPEDYIHRVGRTARVEALGDALTLVSPAEEGDLRAIERAVGARIPRVTLPGFDYAMKAAERFEVPLAERIAAIRAGKAEARARGRGTTAGGRARHRGSRPATRAV